jgi:peptidoglycan/xylan/chitin deacetylase (PgdA/CDA1 family)
VRSRRPPRDPPPLAIFAYHSVVRRPLEVDDFCFIREEEFRAQLDALRRRFRIVPLEEGVRLLRGGELREPSAVLTFDDGFQDNFDVVFPALLEAGVPATIFICTDLLDTERSLWYCRLHQAITSTTETRFDWNGRVYGLAGRPARARAAKTLKNQLKRLPQPELEAAVDEITQRLVALSAADGSQDPRFRLLSREAICAMAQSGLVEFGAHTGSHAILSRLDAARQRDEIERSIEAVSASTGKPCRLFAYPNGRFQDYDAGTLDLLRAAGITVAVTGEKGWNQATTPPLELLRFQIGGEPSMPRFERVLRRCGKSLPAAS